MQKIVRRFNFTTGGKEHEVGVMTNETSAGVYVDDKLISNTQSLEGNNELLFSFKVDVPGMKAVDGFLTMERVQGQWQYMLNVHDTYIDPWWTIERGDMPDAQPREILDASSFAQFEAPARTNVQTIQDDNQVILQTQQRPAQKKDGLSQEDMNLPEWAPPPRSQAPQNSWLACCGGPVDTVSRPRSAALKKQPLASAGCCAPNSDDRNYKDRPVAKTCADGGHLCQSWAEEFFAGH
mmetsp:Transcript_51530/g.81763  ORF Transcript_51530/g.81763 Transcript_51530/m.81763 type:complete len:237 (-) Transcript_51530:79-789(-)